MYCMLEIRDNSIRSLREVPDDLRNRIIGANDNCNILFTLELEMTYAEKAFSKFDSWCADADDAGERIGENLRDAEGLCRDFLSAFRSYVDHGNTMLRQRYRNDPSHANLFHQLTDQYYRSKQPYSFVAILRNYAQHCQNVVHSFLNRDAEGMHPAAVPAKLLEEYTRWEDFSRNYIRSSANPLDLRSEFHGALVQLHEIHEQIMNHFLNLDSRAEDIRFLTNFAEQNYGRDNLSCYHLAKILHKDGGEATIAQFREGKGGGFEAVYLDWTTIFTIYDKFLSGEQDANT